MSFSASTQHHGAFNTDWVFSLGAVGLEVTGEIVDLYKDKDVTLVDANSALLPGELGWHRNVGDRFESLLKAAGVKVKHNVKVTSPDISSSLPTEVTLSDGTKETALYLAATGVKPRTSFLPDSLLTERKFVDTKPTFQSTSESTIFALGDASNNERKLSLSIMSHVPVVANNLLKMMSDPNTPEASLQKYGGDGRTIMGIISFGKSAGGAQLGPVRLPSFLVAMLKGKDMMASRAAGLVR